MRIRIALSAALTALGLMFLTPATAHAHGDTLKVVVTGQREGRVTADITWENDGDAIDETVAATVNAVSVDGTRTLGPWRLIRDPAAAPAGWTTAEALPPGTWKVSVDVGFPALGHGELEVGVPVVDPAPGTGTGTPAASAPAPVAPSATPPSSSASASAASATASSPKQGPAAETEGQAVWWTTAGVAVTALAGAAVGLLLRRRRTRLGRLG
ncbi:hypothetical protein [Streptomyces sp. NBC_01294]|uniref:hypothetical protein n=1 Tax=Streptomyces sp. NBC_01294 TaxID=2903815 RepID=UPI002DDB9B94|nr:hypothetical protein [Streptomyces sp. NBC_01294]WRZ55214.1 hypothetical protein OG534_01105 [Streptomyces sp. NBC_01294]WRZ61491.1 hypothetical protein OG534_36405 [Streptomyces sp. NBC_01294]